MNATETKQEAEIDALVDVVNGLSNDAVYLASRDWFGGTLVGKPVLAAAQNERQRIAFDQLMSVGFAYLDTERGVIGYRSTMRGRVASGICRAALAKAGAA